MHHALHVLVAPWVDLHNTMVQGLQLGKYGPALYRIYPRSVEICQRRGLVVIAQNTVVTQLHL